MSLSALFFVLVSVLVVYYATLIYLKIAAVKKQGFKRSLKRHVRKQLHI